MGELNLANSLKQKTERIIDVTMHRNLLVKTLKERRNSYGSNRIHIIEVFKNSVPELRKENERVAEEGNQLANKMN